MSDQLMNLLGDVKTYLPWVSFLAGLGGSLHCVGMCGGVALATCGGGRDVFRYQFGRLVGYLLLGAFAGALGGLLNIASLPAQFSLIPAFFIGMLFIYWGVQNYRGLRAELPVPKVVGRLYVGLWRKFVSGKKGGGLAFFTGLISILLPCGLLYGVALGTVALQSTPAALGSMFFFWLGTVPSMVVAPGIVQKFLRPFQSKLPKVYALGLMAVGIMTISFRVAKLQAVTPEVRSETTHHCH